MYWKKFLQNVHEAYYIARDPETPLTVGLIGLVGVTWVVFPGDFDFIPTIGWLDDLSVFDLCNRTMRWRSDPEVVKRVEGTSLRQTGAAIVSQTKSLGEPSPSIREIIRDVGVLTDRLIKIWILTTIMLGIVCFFIFFFLYNNSLSYLRDSSLEFNC